MSNELLNSGYAPIDASTSGNNTLVAASSAGLRIALWSYVLVAEDAVTAKFTSGNGGDDLSGPMPFGANGGAAAMSADRRPLLITNTDEALVLNLSGAVAVGGHLCYEYVY